VHERSTTDKPAAATRRAAPPSRPATPTTAPVSHGQLLRLQHLAGNQAVAGTMVQRRIGPEDLAGQMAGTRLTLSGAFSAGPVTLAAGHPVEVVTWVNASSTVRVRVAAPHAQAGTEVDIPKKLVRAAGSPVAGMIPYGTGIETVVKSFEAGEQAIAAEQARKGGARPGEVARMQVLQQNRERLLNKRLIQSTMLNRFDQSISNWVQHYNQTFGFTKAAGKKAALDPNLVKSMVFQETQMGTSGEHLEDTSESDPKVKTRQNLGQMIDSSAAALILIIKEESPALVTKHHLENLERDAAAAGTGEDFMWGNAGFVAAVTEYFAAVPAGAPARNVDYDFWVHAAVRWLFKKRGSVSSWAEAIRAYNGGGARARHYRDTVVARAEAAAKAQKVGKDFVPGRL
jgi:hypothetical protein